MSGLRSSSDDCRFSNRESRGSRPRSTTQLARTQSGLLVVKFNLKGATNSWLIGPREGLVSGSQLLNIRLCRHGAVLLYAVDKGLRAAATHVVLENRPTESWIPTLIRHLVNQRD